MAKATIIIEDHEDGIKVALNNVKENGTPAQQVGLLAAVHIYEMLEKLNGEILFQQ